MHIEKQKYDNNNKKQLEGRLQTVSVKMERRGYFGGTVEGGMDTLCS